MKKEVNNSQTIQRMFETTYLPFNICHLHIVHISMILAYIVFQHHKFVQFKKKS